MFAKTTTALKCNALNMCNETQWILLILRSSEGCLDWQCTSKSISPIQYCCDKPFTQSLYSTPCPLFAMLLGSPAPRHTSERRVLSFLWKVMIAALTWELKPKSHRHGWSLRWQHLLFGKSCLVWLDENLKHGGLLLESFSAATCWDSDKTFFSEDIKELLFKKLLSHERQLSVGLTWRRTCHVTYLCLPMRLLAELPFLSAIGTTSWICSLGNLVVIYGTCPIS